MNGELVQQLSAWLAGTDIGLLELDGPDVRLRLRNDSTRVELIPHLQCASGPAGPDRSGGSPDAARKPRFAPNPLPHAGEGVQPAQATRIVATAASVGVFVQRHPLRDTPLAATGAAVRSGQALGLLQIGALLLPVAAPCDGIVVGALAAHGTVVGYGTPLVELQAL